MPLIIIIIIIIILTPGDLYYLGYIKKIIIIIIHTHICLTALCPGLPRWAGTRKVKPICILLKQETVSGSGISWAICKSALRSRQITMPALHHQSAQHTHTHTHIRLTALFLGVPRSAGTRKVKPIWTLLEQETVSDSDISWAICKPAPSCRQTTTPAPHHQSAQQLT